MARNTAASFTALKSAPLWWHILKGADMSALAEFLQSQFPLPNHFRVPNIVPRDCSYLPIDKYNAIGTAFAKAFRQFLKTSGIGGAVNVTNPNKKLADIIKGDKCRKLFEAWLHSPTPISHPADVEKLYVFICALFRHHSDARSYEIERFLIEDRKWKPNDARFVASEIEKGLTLLRINQKF